ncbi:hypothetical protein CLV58_109207 [Spirosoma oryzae]|uniref:Uncharacterized protein n=1 Tax=Spirosoma oryzae TaxID=1469603 RepID=A0A2T0SYI4_9BACT|nr:hypothetical protein [Spirosoma oryzae]PRY38480.1 hypothetical protein CLV58_109207 [Spirosoma oryzae]
MEEQPCNNRELSINQLSLTDQNLFYIRHNRYLLHQVAGLKEQLQNQHRLEMKLAELRTLVNTHTAKIISLKAERADLREQLQAKQFNSLSHLLLVG